MDETLLRLLDAIVTGGSLRRAATEVDVSYRHAWGLLHKWERLLGKPLVRLERGRGAYLTPLGDKLLWAERRVTARLGPELEGLSSTLESELDSVLETEEAPRLRIFASHDLALAGLRAFLGERGGVHLEMQFRGSLESLRLLGADKCDVAGFHVAEGEPGLALSARYRPWLDPRRHRAIHVARRQQGLMTRRGNPKRIRHPADLTQPGVHFVNRQPDSGTRLLFDALLKRAGIEPGRITGYDEEEFTHLAVAAMVASGAIDAGFGIEAAARQFGLRFVPLARERYLLALPAETLNRPAGTALARALRSAEFRERIGRLSGYDPSSSGTVLAVHDALSAS